MLNTDVNVAVLGEFSDSNRLKVKNPAYITVGTCIGAGFIINGIIIHNLVHPVFGHIYIPHDKGWDLFCGTCPLTKIA